MWRKGKYYLISKLSYVNSPSVLQVISLTTSSMKINWWFSDGSKLEKWRVENTSDLFVDHIDTKNISQLKAEMLINLWTREYDQNHYGK